MVVGKEPRLDRKPKGPFESSQFAVHARIGEVGPQALLGIGPHVGCGDVDRSPAPKEFGQPLDAFLRLPRRALLVELVIAEQEGG